MFVKNRLGYANGSREFSCRRSAKSLFCENTAAAWIMAARRSSDVMRGLEPVCSLVVLILVGANLVNARLA